MHYKTLGHKFKRHAHSMAPKLPITYMCLVVFSTIFLNISSVVDLKSLSA